MLLFKTLPAVITQISDGNMAYHAGDTTLTSQNRQAIMQALNIKELQFPNQIHSSIVQNANSGSRICDGDALISNDKNIAVGVVVADCVPIVFFDPVQNVVAAVHAGWRGTAGNIAVKTILKMQEDFGSKAQDIFAGIGPSIKGCCYEVGAEVAKEFGLTPIKQKIDLQCINREKLILAGVKSIEVLEFCTACDERFFSYRKDTECGRFAAVIWL
ncbi:MAG: hypothetical protein RL154_1532 [Pseudomonadota bacterium]